MRCAKKLLESPCRFECACVFLILLFHWGVVCATGNELNDAVDLYHNADFETAKDIFQVLSEPGKTEDERLLAFAFLAVIAYAENRSDNAEKSIARMFDLKPVLTIADVESLMRTTGTAVSKDFYAGFRKIEAERPPPKPPKEKQEPVQAQIKEPDEFGDVVELVDGTVFEGKCVSAKGDSFYFRIEESDVARPEYYGDDFHIVVLDDGREIECKILAVQDGYYEIRIDRANVKGFGRTR